MDCIDIVSASKLNSEPVNYDSSFCLVVLFISTSSYTPGEISIQKINFKEIQKNEILFD